MSLKSIEIHWDFVVNYCVEAAARVRIAIGLKISLSCQKIYLCCSSILVFLIFRLNFLGISDFRQASRTENGKIKQNRILLEQIMTKIVDFPIPEAGKSPNIGYFDLT